MEDEIQEKHVSPSMHVTNSSSAESIFHEEHTFTSSGSTNVVNASGSEQIIEDEDDIDFCGLLPEDDLLKSPLHSLMWHRCACMYVCMYVCVYVYVYMRMCIYVYMCV